MLHSEVYQFSSAELPLTQETKLLSRKHLEKWYDFLHPEPKCFHRFFNPIRLVLCVFVRTYYPGRGWTFCPSHPPPRKFLEVVKLGLTIWGLWSPTWHIRIHSVEKPYVCSQCDEAFAQGGSFTYHIQSVKQCNLFNIVVWGGDSCRCHFMIG